MAQYQKPLVHNSQDMMQELFEEINGYLGDQGKQAANGSPIQSPFNVSTEEEDDDSIENNQYTTATMDPNNESIKSLSPLQAAMFVESDDDDSYSGDTWYEHTDQAVCACYKCKDEGRLEHTTTEHSTSKSRTLHRPKSTSSFGAVSSAKLAHIAGLVKQTLTSTPRDIISSTKQQHPIIDGLETTPSSAYRDEQDQTHSYEEPMYPQHITTETNDQHDLYNEDDYGSFSSPINLDSFDGQDMQDQGDYGEQGGDSGDKQLLVETVSSNQLPFLTPSHRIGEPHVIALRTSMARDVGSHDDRINAYNNAYSHCIMARTDMVPWIKKQYSKGPPGLIQSYTPRPKRSSKGLFGLFKRHSKLDDMNSLSVGGSTFEAANASISSRQSSFMTESLHTVSPPQQHYGNTPQQHDENNNFSQLLLAPLDDQEQPVSPIDTSRRTSYQKPPKQRLSPSPSYTTGKKKQHSFGSMDEPVSILKKSSSATHLKDEPISILKPPPSFMDEPSSFKSKSQPIIEDRPTSILKSRSPSPSVSMESRHYLSSSPSVPMESRRSQSPSRSVPMESRHYRSSSPSVPMDSRRSRSPSLSVPMESRHYRSSSPSVPMDTRRSRSPSSSVPVDSRRSRSRSPIPHTTAPNISKRNHLLCPPGSMYPSEQPSRQRSRSVSPSPQRSRSNSPMAPPRPFNEHYEKPLHDSDHGYRATRRTPSPSRHYPVAEDQYLSPRRPLNGGHYRSNSHQNSNDRKIHRIRSSEYLDHRGDSTYLLPLEHQPRRLSNASHEYRRPSFPGRRTTEPPALKPRQRRSMVLEEPPCADYFNRRWSQQQPRPTKRADPLDDLCAFFQHLPRHVLADYLQEAHGDFFLAKDLCMEDIMANGI